MSYITKFLAALAALLFTGFTLYCLLLYVKPLNDGFYDLSMFGSDGQMGEWDGDTKGWTVFVQEGEAYHELNALGWGTYNGLDYLGQTIYFSRAMTEKVEKPTLRLYAANWAVAVFLENEVIYTDCPEQDNRVGFLTLPTYSYDREPVILSLPPDYLGKTLTIAQASPEVFDTPSVQVMPCGVEFYCSYTAQSSLISESFCTAIPATLTFTLGILALLALFWQNLHHRRDMGLAAIAVTAFALTLGTLNQASFSHIYFEQSSMDLNALCRAAALSALLIFLGQCGGRLRWILWILALLHGFLALSGRGYAFSQLTSWSELAGCAGLLAAGVLAVLWQKEGRQFYRLFAPVYLAFLLLAAALSIAYGLFSPEWGKSVLLQLGLSVQNGLYRFFLWKWTTLAFAASAVAAIAMGIRQESERRTEARLLLQRGELAQENYENLRNQHEEILALRHDLRHHTTILRSLCQDGDLDRVTAYLNTMGAQNTPPRDYTVHPAVNGVLTAMLSRGERMGIRLEVQVQLPRELPIPDNDLCALLMNLLENALEANEKTPEGIPAEILSEMEKWMKVAIHIRGDYLYIGVENAKFEPIDFDKKEGSFRSTKKGKDHGYGLKSARAITRKYHSELRLKDLDGSFSASTALLLPKQ